MTSIPKIHLTSPCPLKIKKFPGSSEINHCCHCDEKVYDFTTASYEEIKSAFKENTYICGTFNMEQLYSIGPHSEYRKIIPGKFLLRLFLVILLKTSSPVLTKARNHIPQECTICNPADSVKIQFQIVKYQKNRSMAASNVWVWVYYKNKKVLSEGVTNTQGMFIFLTNDLPPYFTIKLKNDSKRWGIKNQKLKISADQLQGAEIRVKSRSDYLPIRTGRFRVD